MLNISAFIFYIFVMSFAPGPNAVMAMANANKYGFKKSLEFILGVFTGVLLIMLLSSYFNFFFFKFIPKIQIFMQIFGAIFMIYLAYSIIKPKDDKNDETTTEFEKPNSKLYFIGLILQFINPQTILFGITVFSNFITPYYKTNLALITFSFSISLISSLAISSWALFGTVFNRFLSKYQKPFNAVMSLLLVYCAIMVLNVI
ncbi:transporter, LysE family [Campylobacter blaseri]|uniref:Lysine transporter LysE n=1 Tax=Campylobacter blaseri TaxID=2042961 RepID=A0A2P8R0R3_9BACT|nr:LysE family transporter [Campylobacter blaseri]PSM52080.1 lysine transporter LysE [Campylobacter blaseri]PSM53865.1 lysine transporter LysE [Campylobacter blaseri]QKF85579.1 transporter, LysE family [Campylobacter blaseri]